APTVPIASAKPAIFTGENDRVASNEGSAIGGFSRNKRDTHQGTILGRLVFHRRVQTHDVAKSSDGSAYLSTTGSGAIDQVIVGTTPANAASMNFTTSSC